MGITLIDIYYQQNKEVSEYRDVYLQTNIGILKIYVSSIDFVSNVNLLPMQRLHELDKYKNLYGRLTIDEARITYDNDIFLLISKSFLLAIEYVLNSNTAHSIQEFRIIEDIHGLNQFQYNEFKELDLLQVPSTSVGD